MCQDVIGRTGGEYLSLGENIRPFTDTERFPHVVIGYQNADTDIPKMRNYALYVTDGYGIYPGKRFVQQYE